MGMLAGDPLGIDQSNTGVLPSGSLADPAKVQPSPVQLFELMVDVGLALVTVSRYVAVWVVDPFDPVTVTV